MDAIAPRTGVTIRYTSGKGETGYRRIVPREVRLAATEWHPEPQWPLEAFDVDKGADGSLAIRDISEWRPEAAPLSAVS